MKTKTLFALAKHIGVMAPKLREGRTLAQATPADPHREQLYDDAHVYFHTVIMTMYSGRSVGSCATRS